MIKLAVIDEGREIVVTRAPDWPMWVIGILSFGLFLFLLLATCALLVSSIAKEAYGGIVMGLIALAGTALVGVLVFACFSTDVMHFDSEGVERYSRLWFRIGRKAIPLTGITAIRIAYEAGDEDTPAGYGLLIETAETRKNIRFGCESNSDLLEEAEKVFVWQWRTLKKEKP